MANFEILLATGNLCIQIMISFIPKMKDIANFAMNLSIHPPQKLYTAVNMWLYRENTWTLNMKKEWGPKKTPSEGSLLMSLKTPLHYCLLSTPTIRRFRSSNLHDPCLSKVPYKGEL